MQNMKNIQTFTAFLRVESISVSKNIKIIFASQWILQK